MFEHIDQETLLQQSLDMVKTNVDKREGSIIWDALAPHSIQLYEMYFAMDGMVREMFGDTASREFLIKLGRDRGIKPYPATKAVLKAEFNIDVPIGARFSLDALDYTVEERLNFGIFKLRCETAGRIGNNYFGTLIPIEYIDGLAKAELTELLVLATDEESTENLRKRYLESFDALAYGGNLKDYKQKVHELQGVGGVKAKRIREDIYNVRLIVLDATYNTPKAQMLEGLQTAIDPVSNHGDGVGIAPIGHVVRVVGATNIKVDITFTTLIFAEGYEWVDVELDVQQLIDDYFLSLRKQWEDSDQLVVRILQVESKMLEVNGVIDVQDTLINGKPANYILDSESIPSRGVVSYV